MTDTCLHCSDLIDKPKKVEPVRLGEKKIEFRCKVCPCGKGMTMERVTLSTPTYPYGIYGGWV